MVKKQTGKMQESALSVESTDDKLINLLNKMLNEFENVESFVEVDESKSERFTDYLKFLYDFLKLNDNDDYSTTTKSTNSNKSQLTELPELIINKNLVDLEQIYQQLQLFNTNNDTSSSIGSLAKYFSKVLVKPDSISFNIDYKTSLNKSKLKSNALINSASNSVSDSDQADQSQSDQYDDSEDEDDDNDSIDNLIKTKMSLKNGEKSSNFGIPDGSDSEISDFEVGDDQDEAENDEDDDNENDNENDDENDDDENELKNQQSEKDGEDDDIDSDEVDDDLVDLYQDLGDEKEVMGLGKPTKSFDEIDFDREDFGLTDENDVLEEEQDNEKETYSSNKKASKSKSKDLFQVEDQEDDEENLQENKDKSSFEIRQEKLKEKIDQVHDSMLNNLNDKKWQLKGEVTAKTRPQDSLLEEYLDFDHTTRQIPVANTLTTEQLEKMIKQRIKDKAFDDVERKIKPVEMNYEFKKQIVLDHEKNKKGLADIYEQEYLKQQQQTNDLLNKPDLISNDFDDKSNTLANKKHEEIRSLMQTLFIKLDALSNFHYTPKAPIPEMKVVSNMPTIAMEEVAPVSVADTNILAPEEVKAKINSLPKSKSEEDKKDKKKKLRVKKIQIKKTSIKKEKRLQMAQALDPDNTKISKQVALNKLKKQAKNMSHNIKILDQDKSVKVNSALKSSAAFFKQLQENTQMSKKVVKKKAI